MRKQPASYVVRPEKILEVDGAYIGLVGWSLEWAGFDSTAQVQSELARRTMVLLMGGFLLWRAARLTSRPAAAATKGAAKLVPVTRW